MRTLLLACVVIALALTACASDDETGTDAEATTTTTVAESTTTTAPATTTTVAQTTTTTAAETTTTSTLPPLPVEGVVGPGAYSTPIGWDGTYAIDSVPISVALTSPVSTSTYGLSDCCGVYPLWGRGFWPEPLPTWMEPFMEWDEDDDRVALVAPLVAGYRLTHFHPSGNAQDGKVAVEDVDDIAVLLAGHPALTNATQPTAVSIGGYEGVRIESAYSGTLGECGLWEEDGVSIRCLIGLDWEGSSEADWRFRTDIVRIGDEVIVLQTRLYPNSEEESKAIADAIIEGIEFPTA